MTIKIVLTGVDAMDWMKTLANIADTKPLYAEADRHDPIRDSAPVAVPPKRTRRTSAQVAADFKAREAAEYAALQAQAALPNDPLADIGVADSVALEREMAEAAGADVDFSAVEGAVTEGHGSPELDEDAAKLLALGADPGPTLDDLDLGDGLLTALVEITDAELQTAAAKKCVEKKEPGNRSFRLLLGKYATQVADIPQDRRQSFMTELAAL